MVRNAALIGAAGLLAYGAWLIWQQSTKHPEELDADQGIGDKIVNQAVSAFRLWRAPEPYREIIAQAEADYNIPPMLLERLLWQESRYRQDIITGKVRSPAGAMGIAQFMPATAVEMGIDPLKPEQAIPAAARYLRRLYNRFGNWTEALAAYNWGQGNVARRGIQNAPRETRNYFTQILADVNSVIAPDQIA